MTTHSESAERAVLGAAMAGSGAIPELLLRICDDAFWAERHRILWRYVRKIHISGQKPDIVTVRDELDREKNLERVGGAGVPGSRIRLGNRAGQQIGFGDLLRAN